MSAMSAKSGLGDSARSTFAGGRFFDRVIEAIRSAAFSALSPSEQPGGGATVAVGVPVRDACLPPAAATSAASASASADSSEKPSGRAVDRPASLSLSVHTAATPIAIEGRGRDRSVSDDFFGASPHSDGSCVGIAIYIVSRRGGPSISARLHLRRRALFS